MKLPIRMLAITIGLLVASTTVLAQTHVHKQCNIAESFQKPCKCAKETKSLTCNKWRASPGNDVCNTTCQVCACTPSGWVASLTGESSTIAASACSDASRTKSLDL